MYTYDEISNEYGKVDSMKHNGNIDTILIRKAIGSDESQDVFLTLESVQKSVKYYGARNVFIQSEILKELF